MRSDEIRKWMDGGWKNTAEDPALVAECRRKAESLLDRSNLVVFVHLDADGRPVVRAMLTAAKESLGRIWFSTNSSSKHVQQIRHNPCATVYFYDPQTYEGVMLAGQAREEADRTWRQRIWQDGYEQHYSGVDDPDYCILRFDASSANYYHGAMNVTFPVNP